jgi:hypothetical protein
MWQWIPAIYVSTIYTILGKAGRSVYMDAHKHYDYEVPIISPTNPRGIKICLDLLDAFSHEEGILSHISFARLKTGFVDQASCDWCSICNGLLHAIYTNTQR